MTAALYRMMNGTNRILLPSFLIAAALDIVYFEVFDAVHLPFAMDPLGAERLAAFLKGLVLLWWFTAAGIALPIFLSSRLRRQ